MDNESKLLLIDTSYCCFYRYHATVNWFALANKEIQLDLENISENSIFMEKFKKKFIDMILDLKKTYNVPFENIIMALDGMNNWRKSEYENYKKNRKTCSSRIYDDKIFKYMFNTILPLLQSEYKINSIIDPRAEGDDVIAVISKYVRTNQPQKEIIIISSDTDLCQLIDIYTDVFDLKKKNLRSILDKDNLTAERYLKRKCLTGDKSDNIPSAFPKCGNKTAEKYIDNDNLLNKKLEMNEEWKNQYTMNKLLIDLNNIPEDIKNSITSSYLQLI